MKRIIPFLLLLLFSSLHARSVMFTMPGDARPALQRFLSVIDHAHYYIDAAIYSFTHKTIAKHLRAAAARGVHVRIIYDKSANLLNPRSSIGYLAKYRNVKVWTLSGRPYRHSGNKRSLMHMKLMIVDHRTIVIGSANWTYSAFGKNYETLLIFDDLYKARRLERAFQQMLQQARPY